MKTTNSIQFRQITFLFILTAFFSINLNAQQYDDKLKVIYAGEPNNEIPYWLFQNPVFQADTLNAELYNTLNYDVRYDSCQIVYDGDTIDSHPLYPIINKPLQGATIAAGSMAPFTIVCAPCSNDESVLIDILLYYSNADSGLVAYNTLTLNHEASPVSYTPISADDLLASTDSLNLHTSYYFPTTAVSQMSESNIYLVNQAGDSQYPITIESIEISGDNDVFNYISSNLPFTIGYDDVVTIPIEFIPLDSTDYTGYLNITWKVFNCTTLVSTVTLHGEGYFQPFPNTPSNLTVEDRTTTQINLSWLDNADNETGFKIQYKIEDGAYEWLDTFPADQTTCSVSGLQPGINYSFRIYAYNDMGCSGASNVVSVTTLREGPTPPENFKATPLDSSIVLTWYARPGSEFVKNYALYRSETTPFTPDSIEQAIALVTDTTFTDTTLALGKKYYYRLSAVDTLDREGDYTETIEAKTIYADQDAPADISDSVAGPHNGYITLKWTNPADKDFAGVRVCMDTTTFPDNKYAGKYVGSIYGGLGAEALLSVPGLVNGKTYYFTLFTFDNVPNYSSGIHLSAVPGDYDPPGRATSVDVQPGNEKNYLYWKTPDDPDYKGIMIRYSTAGYPADYTSGSLVINDNITEKDQFAEYIHASLTNDQLYYYSFFTYDSSGNYSTAVKDTARPNWNALEPPGTLTAIASDASVALSWNEVFMSNGYIVYRNTVPGFVPSSSDSLTRVMMDTIYTDNSVENGITYYYRAASIDMMDKGTAYSNQASAKPCGSIPPAMASCSLNSNDTIEANGEITLEFSKTINDSTFVEGNVLILDDTHSDTLEFEIDRSQIDTSDIYVIKPEGAYWPVNIEMRIVVKQEVTDLCDNGLDGDNNGTPGPAWERVIYTPEEVFPQPVTFYAVSGDDGTEIGWYLSPSDDQVVKYIIYRKLSSEGSFSKIAEVDHDEDDRGTGMSYTDESVSAGLSYDYYVTAENNQGTASYLYEKDARTVIAGNTDDVISEGYQDKNLSIWVQMPKKMSQQEFSDDFSVMVMANCYSENGDYWDASDPLTVIMNDGEYIYIPVKIMISLQCVNKGNGGNIAVGTNPIGDYGELYNIGEVQYEPGYYTKSNVGLAEKIVYWFKGESPPTGPVFGTYAQIMDEFEDWHAPGMLWTFDAAEEYNDDMLFGHDYIMHHYKSMGVSIDDIEFRLDDKVDFLNDAWWANPNIVAHIEVKYNIYTNSFNGSSVAMDLGKKVGEKGINPIFESVFKWESKKMTPVSPKSYFKWCTSLLVKAGQSALDQDFVGDTTMSFHFTVGDGQLSDQANAGSDGIVDITKPSLTESDLYGLGNSLSDFASTHSVADSFKLNGASSFYITQNSISGASLGYSQEQWDDVDYVAVRLFCFSNIWELYERLDDELFDLNIGNPSIGLVPEKAYAAPVNVFAAGAATLGQEFSEKSLGGYFNAKIILPREHIPDNVDEYFNIQCNVPSGKKILFVATNIRFIGVEHSELNEDYLFTLNEDHNLTNPSLYSTYTAWGDYNNDGIWDALVNNQWGSTQYFELYDGMSKNKVSSETGVDLITASTNTNMRWGDYNNDGYQDIFIINKGLIKNNQGSFTDVTDTAFEEAWSEGLVSEWIDYDQDNDLDISIIDDAGKLKLYRNNAGVFTPDTNNNAMIDSEITGAKCIAWNDVNNDGWPDVYVGTYGPMNENKLFINYQGSFMSEMINHPYNTVSALWADYDSDGDDDLYLVNDYYNTVYSGECKLFNNESDSSTIKLTDVTTTLIGDDGHYHFDAAFGDLDSDGDLDLFLFGMDTASIARNKLFFNKGNNTWKQPGILPKICYDSTLIKSASWVDYDNRYGLDLFIGSSNKDNLLYDNNLEDIRLLKVRCIPINGPAYAPGAKVSLYDESETLLAVRTIGAGVGFSSQSPPEAVFGVDRSNHYKVSVEFPSGNTIDWNDAPDMLDTAAVSMAIGWYMEVKEEWDASIDRIFTVDNNGIDFPGDGIGSAWADFDGDNDLDLFLCNEDGPAKFYVNNSNTFTDATMQANLGSIVGVQGATLFDYDADGDVDIITSNGIFNSDVAGEIKILVNNGNGRFTESNQIENWNGEMVQVIDYDLDGDLDINIDNLTEHQLYRNDNQTYNPSGFDFIDILGGEANIWSMVWGDYNNDRYPDALVISEGRIDIIVNNAGTFSSSINLLSNPNLSGRRSGCFADFDNDGDLDVFINRSFDFMIGAEAYLFINNDSTFTSNPYPVSDDNEFGTSIIPADFDNDGDLDIFEASDGQRNYLHVNDGTGNFTHQGSPEGPTGYHASQGATAGDFDDDGDIDIFLNGKTSTYNNSPMLFVNNSNDSAWLKVKLVGTGDNPLAIGSMVRIYDAGYLGNMDHFIGMRYINSGESYYTSNDLTAHFGLEEGNYDVEATFPQGEVVSQLNVGTGQTVIIYETPLEVIADAGNNKIICEGDTATLTATGGITYVWNTSDSTASIKVSPVETTTYYVTVSYGSTTDNDSVTIYVMPKPTIAISNDTSICTGDSVILSIDGGGSYLWNTADTTSNITVGPLLTTTYSVDVSLNGCSATDTTVVTVIPLPDADAGNDQTICTGGKAFLTASGGDTYYWSTGETVPSIEVGPVTTTTYYVTVSSNGCSNMDTVMVNVSTSNTADAGEDKEICKGDSISITAIGGNGFEWNNGDTTATIVVSPDTTTTYSVLVLSGTCSDNDSIKVTVKPVPMADAGEGQTICTGGTASLTASGGDSYVWNTGDTTASITVNPEITTTYKVTVSINGCSVTDSVTVNMGSSITAGAGGDKEICIGGTVELIAQGGNLFEWNTGDTTSNIRVSPASTTSYVVTVSSGTCSDNDSAIVIVHPLPLLDLGNDTTISSNQVITISADTNYVSYTWDNDSTGNSISIDGPVMEPGKYQLMLTVTDSNQCQNSDTIMVTIEEKTDKIELKYIQGHVKLYPNPSNGLINLEIENSDETPIEITILNESGSIIFRNEYVSQPERFNEALNLEGYNNGIYFLQVQKGKTIRSEKFILLK